jgi:putative resolvase
MDTYLTGADAASRLGLCQATLRAYDKAGKIETIRVKGKRRYNVAKFLRESGIKEEKRTVCYCRVSTHGQSGDLARQIEYMKEKYPEAEIISDVGSGINFQRAGLIKIIDYAIRGELGRLIVAYKDRLCRIGYDLIRHILLTYSKTEIIIDNDITETVNEELAQDIIQIITVYSAKINGMRKYKKRAMEL